MSDIISGLLWNTCFAGGLAIVLFLAQQTRYLRIRPHVCHALWLLVLVKLITPTLLAVPVSIGWVGTGQEKNERLANTLPAIGNARSGIDGPIRPGVQGEEAMPAQTLEAYPDIGLDIFQHMSEMQSPVGIRQGRCHQYFSWLGVACVGWHEGV